jgi:hypothetical protein
VSDWLCWLFGHQPVCHRTATTFQDWFSSGRFPNGRWFTAVSSWVECSRCGRELDRDPHEVRPGVEQ